MSRSDVSIVDISDLRTNMARLRKRIATPSRSHPGSRSTGRAGWTPSRSRLEDRIEDKLSAWMGATTDMEPIGPVMHVRVPPKPEIKMTFPNPGQEFEVSTTSSSEEREEREEWGGNGRRPKAEDAVAVARLEEARRVRELDLRNEIAELNRSTIVLLKEAEDAREEARIEKERADGLQIDIERVS